MKLPVVIDMAGRLLSRLGLIELGASAACAARQPWPATTTAALPMAVLSALHPWRLAWVTPCGKQSNVRKGQGSNIPGAYGSTGSWALALATPTRTLLVRRTMRPSPCRHEPITPSQRSVAPSYIGALLLSTSSSSGGAAGATEAVSTSAPFVEPSPSTAAGASAGSSSADIAGPSGDSKPDLVEKVCSIRRHDQACGPQDESGTCCREEYPGSWQGRQAAGFTTARIALHVPAHLCHNLSEPAEPVANRTYVCGQSSHDSLGTRLSSPPLTRDAASSPTPANSCCLQTCWGRASGGGTRGRRSSASFSATRPTPARLK